MFNKHSKWFISIGFMIPAILLVFSLIFYPIFRTILLSFQNVRFFGTTNREIVYTLKNYSKLFNSSSFWQSLNITAIYTISSVIISFIIGLVTALLINYKFIGNRIARIAFLLAWPIPTVAVSLMFVWMFDPSFGVMNYILQSLHLIDSNVKWLLSPKTALAITIAATIWKAYPFFTLMLYAGLQSIPEELYDAASIDGANGLNKFKYITLPGLRSIITISILLNGLWAFRNFAIIFVMTGGGPFRITETLPIKLYQEAFNYYQVSYASAIGVISLLICIFVIVFAAPLLKKRFF